MPARAAVLSALAAWLDTQPIPTGARALRVAVDGVDTAGKTTLADELAVLLQEQGRCIIRASVDGFHNPRAIRHQRGPESPAGFYHDTFDYAALRALLLDPLGVQGDGRCRTACYDLNAEQPIEAPVQSVPGGAILLCDGIFLARPELAACWDVHIFLHIDFETVLRRAAQRDADRFGGASRTTERYQQRYIPGQQLYLAEAHPAERAAIVLDNTIPAAPHIIRAPWRTPWQPETR